MRSLHLLSLASSVAILSYSPCQAQHSHGHEKPRARHRHVDNPYVFDAKHKRDENVAFTYFNDGQGACGITSSPSDFIVALNSAEYDGGAHCFDMITITVNGKTAQAQIVDECTGCQPGGLDFSQGLFEYFAQLSEGELYGSWSYNSDTTTSSSTPAPPQTTPTRAPTSTATISFPSPSSSSSAMSTTSMTSAPTSVSSQTSTTITLPTSTPQDPQIIAQIDLALLEIGTLLQGSFNL